MVLFVMSSEGGKIFCVVINNNIATTTEGTIQYLLSVYGTHFGSVISVKLASCVKFYRNKYSS